MASTSEKNVSSIVAGHRLQHHFHGGHAVTQRIAEIPLKYVADVAEILDVQRAIKTEGNPRGFDLLGGGVLGPKQISRITANLE